MNEHEERNIKENTEKYAKRKEVGVKKKRQKNALLFHKGLECITVITAV